MWIDDTTSGLRKITMNPISNSTSHSTADSPPNLPLLIELFTEELPPKALAKLSDAFAAGITNGLKSRDFLEPGSVTTAYATPRRLAVLITQVRAASPDKAMREKVLPIAIALDKNGEPTTPLIKKLAALKQSTQTPQNTQAAQPTQPTQNASSASLTLNDLERASDGKAECFFYNYTASGSPLAHGLQAVLEETIAKLPIPKLMNYQRPDGATVQFVRPVHRLIALHGAQIVPIALLGLQAGAHTGGHRFLAPREIQISNADAYATTLETQGKVIASIPARKEKIRQALLAQAGADQVLMPESLLDEVTALVEWPVVYPCEFEPAFLSVPQECLILTMQTNQKYFALTDVEGRLRSRFLVVSNLETAHPQAIVQGNERVVRPRLSDAKFFFEQDKKKKLADRLPGLAKVIYHNKLGTQAQRVQRVQDLALSIAAMLGADAELAKRAALLAKADLLTDMVGEFPELQGTMGTYYARHDGEADEVAQAISEHYQPRFAGDALPTSRTGIIVALADKLETLTGLFSIRQQPSGDKDPFALRRHALGVIRIVMEKKLPLNLPTLLAQATAITETPASSTTGKNTAAEVMDFIFDRLRSYLRDKDFSSLQVESVVASRPSTFNDIVEKLEAVKTFSQMPQAEALAAANKRIINILKKADIAADSAAPIDASLLREDAEKNLYAAMLTLKPKVETAFSQSDFTRTLTLLADLRQPVDAFFADVMVMAEEIPLRNNRIALLSNLHTMMNQVADISKLAA